MQGDIMNASWKNRLPLVLAAAVVAVGLVVMARWQPAAAALDDASAPGRYSVIETEAHNLIVTDNKTNTLYFYTIDKDKEVGSELKLRGTIDLSQVGKPEIKVGKPKAE
jgi:hypothetical protein